ncbi:MAG: PDZ domain-containing protein [Rhodanobacteraceae bacterium]|jgi:S1-C subfamily serine protease|nr:PDZ domain-containing protein [Rhodanobacteraceae bacterium]
MKRSLLSLALGLTMAAPAVFAADTVAPVAPAAAPRAADAEAARAELAQLRTQMQALSRRMAELSLELGDAGPRAYAFRYLGQPDRAMLGVVLASDPNGVRIAAVTPDSAAARAGLHDGDVITSIDGAALANKATPEQALADARTRLGNLKNGQEVRLGWQRGGKAQAELTLKAERRQAWNWVQAINGEAAPPLPKDFDERVRADVERAQREAERAGREVERSERVRAAAERAAARVDPKRIQAIVEGSRHAMRLAMPWWGLNLAPMNADLGSYFGVERGALVLATDADALPGLRAGDVITEVGGEAVTRPEDALRALRDQPPGSEVPVKLMRERKTLALNIKAPEFNSIFPLPPQPPVPPAPPAPPRAPAAAPPAPPAPPSDV